ncbi:GGDEF domain-containing protein [Paenibacillus sp. LHD-117]|uniref:GGDEF domain-containing protein n=1 Tax=Paenibacillus sp. LHD-117 TaxID=3071412 RepID=UPI0027DF4F77|nr:GGDEF domain-containing protein [Paenibacillus sp. LHD-117]MDQ6418384.1 GGDEF domain-containing protein [Paenibacillus sp. LHD-117]
MGEIGFGLLNRELIKKIKEMWRFGEIAVLFLRVHLPNAEAEKALARWEKEQRGMFWRQKLGQDYLFFMGGNKKGSDIRRTTEQASQSLRERLAAAHMQAAEAKEREASGQIGWLHIGLAYAVPDPHQSTESVVFHGMLEAMEQSAYYVHAEEVDRHDYSLMETIEVQAATAEAAIEPSRMDSGMGAIPIGRLAAPIQQFQFHARVSEVAYLFDTDPKAYGVVIVKDSEPVGLLMKEKLYQLLAGQYGLPLYWNRPVDRIMDNQPLIVDENMPVEQVSQLAMARNFSRLYDIVIITRAGSMAGATSIRDILECITTMRTEEARTANPLTGLPGNEGIQFELQRRIGARKPTAIVYADLDYFKWFNDCFGFSLGDELIRTLAGLMTSAFKDGADERAFIGHIGGDDFIAILDPGLAEAACQKLIELFDERVQPFYGGSEVKTVEDRHGNLIAQEGVTLSLSLMIWDVRVPISPGDISRTAARLKKKAKATSGSVYVMEQLDGAHQERDESKRDRATHD